MKDSYEKAEIEVIRFEAEDIITSSGGEAGEGGGDDLGG